MSILISNEVIKLNKSKENMVISGWGKETVENSVVEKIEYSSDDISVPGYIAYPKNRKEGEKYPVILWNRGGYNERGSIDEFNARGIFGQLASWGYVVLASMYRGSRDNNGDDEFGGNDVNDIKNMMSLLDELPFADREKVGIEGWSRGGMMSYLLLKQGIKAKCAVITCALSDLNKTAEENPHLAKAFKERMGKENFDQKMKERSAINFVDQLPKDTHYLLMHGGSDEVVSPKMTLRMGVKMSDAGFEYRLLILENGDHFLKKQKKDVDNQKRLWYKAYLI